MPRPATVTDYRRAMALDAVGALAVGSYTVTSFLGPVPTWAQVAYTFGAVAAGASALILRNYVSLACFAVVIACGVYQLAAA